MGVDEALVHTLIAAAEQHRTRPRRPILHRRVIQPAAYGREQHQRRRLRFCTIGADGGQTARQRFGHHHHAGAAAKRAVIDAAVVTLGMVAQAPQPHLQLARGVGTPRHAAGQKGLEQLGEQGDDVKAHGGFSSQVASRP